jgi:hypothetical protein
MPTVAATASCTSRQRLYIRSLLRRCELSTCRFGFQHRVPFKAAGLPEPPMDRDVDTHLQALTLDDASRLIKALVEQAGKQEDDE